MSARQWVGGILRGQSGACPHRIWRVCRHTPSPLVQASNPDFPHLTHAVTMAVHLTQVQTMITEPYRLLRPRQQADCKLSSSALTWFDGGNFMASVLWMWHACRSGIAVCIRSNTVALFVPFCNPEYCNTWSDHAKARVPRQGLPAAQWWANGWTLCGDKVSDQLWSDSGVCAILHMLLTACQESTLSDCDFIINKKDSAVVRRDQCDALNPLDPYQAPRHRPPLVPVLSLYTGSQFADIAMPLPVDWHRLAQGAFHAQHPQSPVKKPRNVPWQEKRDCAVFRGSLTGTGSCAATNQRMALLQLHNGVTLDFRGTGKNQRWRYCPLSKSIVMPQHTQDVGAWHRIPMHEQQELYRYALTIDGHSGADRLAALMQGNQCILKVNPPCHALCPDTWASQRMFAWEHYVPVHADLSNLESNFKWAQNAHDARECMLKQCQLWSQNERKRVIAWWAQATADMSLLH